MSPWLNFTKRLKIFSLKATHGRNILWNITVHLEDFVCKIRRHIQILCVPSPRSRIQGHIKDNAVISKRHHLPWVSAGCWRNSVNHEADSIDYKLCWPRTVVHYFFIYGKHLRWLKHISGNLRHVQKEKCTIQQFTNNNDQLICLLTHF